MTQKHSFLYLASQSPRRAQLLGQLGVRAMYCCSPTARKTPRR